MEIKTDEFEYVVQKSSDGGLTWENCWSPWQLTKEEAMQHSMSLNMSSSDVNEYRAVIMREL